MNAKRASVPPPLFDEIQPKAFTLLHIILNSVGFDIRPGRGITRAACDAMD